MFNFRNLLQRGRITKNINAKDYITVQKPDASGNFEESAISAADLKSEIAKSITHPSGGGGDEFTYIEVPISQAQILDCGSNPLELLPAPGANLFYEYHGILEYTYAGAPVYTLANDAYMVASSNSYEGTAITRNMLGQANDKFSYFRNGSSSSDFLAGDYAYQSLEYGRFNEGLHFFTFNGVNPTGGQAGNVLLAKIWYKVKTKGTEL